MTKTQLTAYEVVMAYIANRHEGVHMDVVAKMYDVNSGRIAEAVLAVEYTVKHVKEIYKLAQAAEEPIEEVYHMAQKAKGNDT